LFPSTELNKQALGTSASTTFIDVAVYKDLPQIQDFIDGKFVVLGSARVSRANASPARTERVRAFANF